MNDADLGVEVAQALATLTLALLTWAGARLGRLLDARAKGERLRGAIVTLDDAVSSVVRELQQVTVEALKGATAGGKLSDSVKAMLRRAAVGAVKQHLGPKGVAAVARAYALDDPAVERLIVTRVEAALYDLRVQRRAQAAAKSAAHAAAHTEGG
jgi:hypothetical protein